ncbi:MAG TPA: hypothetical protein VFG73_01765 [Rhodanobacteraceae bacterium]|nr:hypothetical protein [Rhodanobacteraceae bacterium]
MPDILIRGIDDGTAERIKTVARERRWSINDVILHLLHHGLGIRHGEPLPAPRIAHLAGTWDAEETRAFKEAMESFERVPEGRFAHFDR